MSKARKIFSFVVVLALALGVFAPAYAYTVADDVAGTEYEDIAAVLGALDIMVGDKETGAFRPNDDILRSEVATVAVRELGLDSVANNAAGQQKFMDVVQGHWANGFINVAASQKIVVGDDGINFRPDDIITIEEAAVIFTKILGYEPRAEQAGGFPTGYMITANSIGLFKGVSNLNGNATRGTIAKMAENALEIKKMEQTGYGENIQYEVVDKTILKDTLNVDKEYGQITGNMFTRLDGPSALKKDEVEIDGEIFKDKNGLATSLLGYKVMYLSRENKSTRENEILLALQDKNSMNKTSVEGEDIVAVTGDGRLEMEYWENKTNDNKTRKLTISEEAKMIYNSMANKFDKTLIKPDSGTISGVVDLIDTDRDDVYDLVIVTNYENYVVDDISTVSYKVFDKYEKDPLVLDPNDKNLKFTLTKGGATLNFEDLKEWNVLSVAKSKDGTAMQVQVSDHKVEGKVTEISKNYVYFGDEKYKIADNYTKQIELNDEGTFYLDQYNRIAAVDTKARYADQYAFLDDAYATNAGRDVKFSIFTAEGKMLTVDGAERMSFNNQGNLKPAEVLEKLMTAQSTLEDEEDAAQKTLERQLITYELNDQNQLRVISTAEDKTDGTIDERKFTKNVDEKGLEYKASASKLGNYNVSNKTIIFDIPENAKDDTDYSVRDKSMLIDRTQYDVVMYDVTEDMTATVMVITNSDGIISGETNIAVVDSIATVTNDEKTKVDKLYAYQGGKLVGINATRLGLFVDEESNPLKQGDIIQFKTNAKGEIDKFNILLAVDDKETEFTKSLDNDTSIVYGKVERRFTNSINVTVNDANMINYTLEEGVTVYNYDSHKAENQVSISSVGDIQKYDEADPRRVFLKLYKDKVTEIVIVR